MENKSHAIAAGAFVLLVAALLVALAVWLTRDTSEQRVYEISTRDGVTGLQPQAGVRYKGVLVGKVTDIDLDSQTRGNVLVRIAVNERAPVTTTTFASLGFQGVTGLAFIQLDDNAEGSPVLATERGQVGRIPMRAGMVSRLTEQGGALLGNLEQASQKLNLLLAQENQKTLVAAVQNLGQAAASLQQLTQRADRILIGQAGEGAPSLPQMTQQAEATLRSIRDATEKLGATAEAVRNSANEFRRVSSRMTDPGGTLERMARSADAVAAASQNWSAGVVPRLNRSADETTRTVRQVGRLAETLNDNPQSLLLGKGGAAPGPGEPGFVSPPAK